MIEANEITDFKEITTENPIKQIWKLLRFSLDVPTVSDMIRKIHNIEKGKYDQDVEKQARQIGYCIRQAEEYFHASSQVDLPTRPLLLYYGASSLSWALILLRKSGDYSFDKLRKDHKHRHHGLELRGEARPDDGLEAFLNSLQCKLYTKKDGASQEDIPWGTFALFYQSLVPCAYHIEAKGFPAGREYIMDFVLNCADLLPLDPLITKRFDALELVKSLPDMYYDLPELYIQPDLCEGSVIVETGLDKQLVPVKKTYTFHIDRITPHQKDCLSALFELYKSRNPSIKIQNLSDTNKCLELTEQYSPSESEEVKPVYYPDIVDDINGQKFYILKPQDYLPETAAYFTLLFSLGMLSRYYPDIWMKAIQDVQIAEFTDSLLNVIYRKFPNLILDQMKRVKHYIHI